MKETRLVDDTYTHYKNIPALLTSPGVSECSFIEYVPPLDEAIACTHSRALSEPCQKLICL